MTDHPINTVIVDGVGVSKSSFRSFEETTQPLRLADATALRALDLSSSWLVFIDGVSWIRDTIDTTGIDDGSWTIADNVGNRWKKVPQLSAFDAYGVTATDKATYDASAAGFVFFSLDEYGIYVKKTATSGDWSSLVPFRGPRGGDRYEIVSYDSGQPGIGEMLFVMLFTTAVSFAAAFSGSEGYATTTSTGTAVYHVQKNGSNIGTVTFSAGVATPVFAMASITTFSTGDRLSIVAPSPQDVSLGGVSITLLGSR